MEKSHFRMRFRLNSVAFLSAFIMLGPLMCLGQEASDSWLVLSSGARGSINAHTTRQDLVRLYGASNVVDQEADVGEGEIEPATFLFLQDPERRIEILWKDPDGGLIPAK